MPTPDSSAKQSEQKKLPRHVGIIMDGNGRWAQRRNLPRQKGHLEGLSAAKLVIKEAAEIGLEYVSLFAFSTENWTRTKKEVSYLMFLVEKYLRNEFTFYKQNNIRVVHSGDTAALDKKVIKAINETIDRTKANTGVTVNLAINYGGRDEIIRAIKKCEARTGHAPLTEDELGAHLDHPDFPDVDLIIRTSGERRLSNFLLWQSSYAEYFFSEKLWPDWTGEDLKTAVADYQNRIRRFGNAE